MVLGVAALQDASLQVILFPCCMLKLIKLTYCILPGRVGKKMPAVKRCSSFFQLFSQG